MGGGETHRQRQRVGHVHDPALNEQVSIYKRKRWHCELRAGEREKRKREEKREGRKKKRSQRDRPKSEKEIK